jgi:hypothetical protein
MLAAVCLSVCLSVCLRLSPSVSVCLGKYSWLEREAMTCSIPLLCCGSSARAVQTDDSREHFFVNSSAGLPCLASYHLVCSYQANSHPAWIRISPLVEGAGRGGGRESPTTRTLYSFMER